MESDEIISPFSFFANRMASAVFPDAVGPHLQKLYDTMQGIQYGRIEDRHGWCVPVA